MRVLSLLAVMLFGLAGLPAFAQAPPEGTPTAVRGTVEKLDGQSLTVKPKEGPTVTVALAANFTVAGSPSAASPTSSPAIMSRPIRSRAPTASCMRSRA